MLTKAKDQWNDTGVGRDYPCMINLIRPSVHAESAWSAVGGVSRYLSNVLNRLTQASLTGVSCSPKAMVQYTSLTIGQHCCSVDGNYLIVKSKSRWLTQQA